MPRTLSALGLFTVLVTVSAQEPPGGYEHTPVAVQPAMRAALLKRIALEKAEGPANELLTKIAADNKLKIEFSPLLLKQNENLVKGIGRMVPQKGVRLDIVLHQFLTDAGIPPVCVVKGDVLVFTTEADPAAVVKKKATQPGAVVVSTVRQAPDASHAFIASAIRKKLTEKAEYEAMNNVPFSEVCAAITKKTGMPFPIHTKSFETAGKPNVAEQKVSVKGGKSVTHESVLREALKAIDGELYIDPYAHHEIVHKDHHRRLMKK